MVTFQTVCSRWVTLPYLFSRIRGKVEDEHGEEGYADAGNDEVHRVEEGLASQGHVEGDV